MRRLRRNRYRGERDSIMNSEPVDSCPFCAYLLGTARCAFVTRTDQVASLVNMRQYERGALLVIPVTHAASVLELDQEQIAAVHVEAARVGRALFRTFCCSGLNIFQNNGLDAGQHVPHFHVHVVPRYPGSDPRRIFQQADSEPVPFERQIELAAAVQAALG
jgi:histidine triad (HIT) family protein